MMTLRRVLLREGIEIQIGDEIQRWRDFSVCDFYESRCLFSSSLLACPVSVKLLLLCLFNYTKSENILSYLIILFIFGDFSSLT